MLFVQPEACERTGWQQGKSRRTGLLARKIGMTAVFDEWGHRRALTAIQVCIAQFCVPWSLLGLCKFVFLCLLRPLRSLFAVDACACFWLCHQLSCSRVCCVSARCAWWRATFGFFVSHADSIGTVVVVGGVRFWLARNHDRLAKTAKLCK